ncbi:L,D-transpeptidase [Microvirga zambiensis]|uniref:L,D-transpeptidase n=1 Tax=Microvirga zambiensis TaxID=1402137 RepID=UPI003CCE15F6
MRARAAIAFAVMAGALACASDLSAREVVPFDGRVSPGTVVIKTGERKLYYVRGDGTALRYRVAVGRPGKQWFGEAQIDGKYVRPAWSPPAEVKRDNPRLPDVIPGGAPNNPMGARALTLSLDEYAIHGTNRPSSIGTYASYGCIRMLNEDIVHLYDQVNVGTRVVVVP